MKIKTTVQIHNETAYELDLIRTGRHDKLADCHKNICAIWNKEWVAVDDLKKFINKRILDLEETMENYPADIGAAEELRDLLKELTSESSSGTRKEVEK